MKGIVIGLFVILVVACLFGFTRYLENERRRRWLKRFAGRRRIPYRSQIRSELDGDSSLEIEIGWEAIGAILKVDPDLLRPNDRFDGILGEDRQFPVEGEFHDLCDELSRCKTVLGNVENIETIWNAAQLIGKKIDGSP